MRYWLMKSEPGECSVDDAAAAPNATVPWVGVRNFQARNFLRQMQPGDLVLFYHSVTDKQIVGIAEVAALAAPAAPPPAGHQGARDGGPADVVQLFHRAGHPAHLPHLAIHAPLQLRNQALGEQRLWP